MQSQEILDKILKGSIDKVSREEFDLLLKDRELISPYLLSSLSKKIPGLLQEEDSDFGTLFWQLNLSGFFKLFPAFEWIIQLFDISTERLDEKLGPEFISECFPNLLAKTSGDHWTILKSKIENPDLDIFLRDACIRAFVHLVLEEQLSRSDIIEYFKTLLTQILEGSLDSELSSFIISACCDLWPQECLEEIRECFGIDLVDTFHISISDVLESLELGKEKCLEEERNHLEKLQFPTLFQDFSDEEKILDTSHKLSKLIGKSDIAIEQILRPKRNDPCPCKSGKKYKKCCLNKSDLSDSLENLKITHQAQESKTLRNLPDSEKDAITSLLYLTGKDPTELVNQVQPYLTKYPDIPCLYNFLYCAYRNLQLNQKAINLLRKMLNLFPNYLFARIEYALYLCRRGESEKAHASLNYAVNLSQLYPDREEFHESEWRAFAFVMSLIFLEKDDIRHVRIYANILKKIDLHSAENQIIEKKVREKTFIKATGSI